MCLVREVPSKLEEGVGPMGAVSREMVEKTGLNVGELLSKLVA